MGVHWDSNGISWDSKGGFKLILMEFYKQHLEILGNKNPVVRILFISGNINGILCYIVTLSCQYVFYMLFGGLEHEFSFSIYWEFHHPNRRTPSFFRGVGIPPTRYNSKVFLVESHSFVT